VNNRRTGPLSDLHRQPPLTLHDVRERLPWLLPGAVALAILLAVAAGVDGGQLLVWDAKLTDAAVRLRSPGVDRAALWLSRLGSTPVVLAAGAAGVALAARRCRSVALVMLVTVAARPPLEWLLKEIVQRPRPSGARLVAGTGFAYPSGHVLAAAATWGFVPVIAGLYLKRRWLWWTLSALTWTLIGVVAWTRVWLGVHWTSDVIGGLAIAFVALSLAEHTLDRRHAETGSSRCAGRSWPRSPPGSDQPPLWPNRIAVSGPRGTPMRSPTWRSRGLDETNANVERSR
jgi:membrane-associated phospholipid phosphatase